MHSSDKPKVLIVDDEPDQVELLCLQLEDDYLPIPANSGKEALDIVKDLNPDLILLDLMLPGVDGFEVCRRIKNDPASRFIPVIIISGFFEKSNKIKAVEYGADDFINKPIDRFELKTRIRSLVRLKKNYEALQESENRYKQFFNNSPAVTLLVEPGRGLIVDANDPACSYYGYTREELTAKRIFEINLMSGEKAGDLQQLISREKKGHFYSSHKLASGEIRDVEVYTNLINVKGKELLFTNVYDITASKQTEKDLVESEEKFKNLVEMAIDGIFVETDRGEILDCNNSACRMFGYTKEEMVGLTIADLVPEDFAKTLPERITAEETTGDVAVERVNKKKDGTIFPTEISTKLFKLGGEERLIAYVRDITEHKKSEEALKASEENFRALFEHTPDGILILDFEGNILSANAAVGEMVDAPLDNVIGSNIYNYLVPESGATDLEDQINVYNDRGGYLRTYKILSSNGETVWIEGLGTRIMYRNMPANIVVVRDVTVRKQAEKTLIDAKMAAEEANRTKSEFLANMSHELRTPLNSVIGFSDLIAEGTAGPLTEKQSRYIGFISVSGKNLLRIINDILDLSKAESGKMELDREEFCVGKSVDKVISTMLPQTKEKNIMLSHKPGTQALTVYADPSKFEQIMYNLLSNATKFTPEGGSINVFSEKDGEMVRVVVRDTGIGISEENLNKIFNPFIQIDSSMKRSFEGTGLGLSLVKKFVEMHGGNIRVQSKLGEGTAFTFELPASPSSGM